MEEYKKPIIRPKTRKLSAEIPAAYLFTIEKIKEEDFYNGEKNSTKEVVQRALDMYFKSRGYPEVRN